MKTLVLTGSTAEIAESLARIDGKIREAIVFVDEAVNATNASTDVDAFAEMDELMVQVGNADYDRQSIYSPRDGE